MLRLPWKVGQFSFSILFYGIELSSKGNWWCFSFCVKVKVDIILPPFHFQISMSNRVECGNFFWSERTRASKFSFSKHFQGAQILIFFVKIGVELPFTLKNKCRSTNSKFVLLKSTILDPLKSAFFVFEEKPPPKKLVLCVLALIQL